MCQNFLPFLGKNSILHIHILFIHLSIGRHLGCFHPLALVNTINVGIHVYVHALLWVLLGKYPEMELLDHMVIPWLISWKTTILFPQWLYHFIFLPATHEDSSFSTSSPALIIFWFFDSSHSDGYDFPVYFDIRPALFSRSSQSTWGLWAQKANN